MPAVKGRRQEYAEATNAALIEAATRLFSDKGFVETSIEDVVREARVSAGALYHHFRGKKELFRVVQETVQQRAMSNLSGMIPSGEPSWEWLTSGLRLYLGCCSEPTYRSIVLQEGPTALGWTEWRRVDRQFSLPLLEQLLDNLIGAGVMKSQPVPLTSRVLCAAIGEAALAIAAGEIGPQEAEDLLVELVSGLAV